MQDREGGKGKVGRENSETSTVTWIQATVDMQESGATAASDREGGQGKVGREKLKIGEESLSGSASWSRFGYSSIHSKFLAHCLIDGKGRAPFGRARTFWKGMPNFA